MAAATRHRRRRSLVHALAVRERDGRCAHISEHLSRRRWTMSQVLARDDCAVLLGFSSDGNFLLYYSVSESSYVVFWKRIQSALSCDRLELRPALLLHVGKQAPVAQTFGSPNVGSSLRVWQSVDEQIVAAIATDNTIASQDATSTYHFTISPSPTYCCKTGVGIFSSLSFSQTVPLPTQELEPWQLISFSRDVYLLILNMGSSVTVLGLHLRQRRHNGSHSLTPMPPRIYFDELPWYTPSEYPIEFAQRDTMFGDATPAASHAMLECVCQQQFDCEAFLADFLQKYAAFRHLHLVDYDLHLVRAYFPEKMLFMMCIADLESSPSISSQRVDQPRLALFFALKLFTGQYHVLRALKVPRMHPLRFMSSGLARKFCADLTDRIPKGATATEWSNNPVQQGRSLEAVHNPCFPVSIYFK